MWPEFSDLLRAYRECRIGKPASSQQTQFEWSLGKNLLELVTEIHQETYTPSSSTCFIVERPCPREIFAAHFRDRIVHHLIVSKLTPFWELKFSSASFACRKKRGTHGAIRALEREIKRISRSGSKKVAVLKLDIASFFATINRDLLCKILLERNGERLVRFLIPKTFGHDARTDFIFKSNHRRVQALIPPHKSWLHQKSHQGLPIGNLTSQFGANVYLTEMDDWITQELRPRSYLRYMDDLLFLGTRLEELGSFENAINTWLVENRGQSLNPKKTKCLFLTEGIDYLGYRFIQTRRNQKTHQVLFKKQKKWSFIQDLKNLEKRGLPLPRKLHVLAPYPSRKLQAQRLSSVQARLGLMSHASTYQFKKKALAPFSKAEGFQKLK